MIWAGAGFVSLSRVVESGCRLGVAIVASISVGRIGRFCRARDIRLDPSVGTVGSCFAGRRLLAWNGRRRTYLGCRNVGREACDAETHRGSRGTGLAPIRLATRPPELQRRLRGCRSPDMSELLLILSDIVEIQVIVQRELV